MVTKSDQKALKKVRSKFTAMEVIVPKEIPIHHFSSKGLNDALDKLGWSLDSKGFIKNKNNDFVKCEHCDKRLSTVELSAFSPGSIKQLCSDIDCFIVDMHRREKKR